MSNRTYLPICVVAALLSLVAPLSAATVVTQFAATLDASIVESNPVNAYTGTATFTLTEPMGGLPTLSYSIQLNGPDLNIDGILPNGYDPVIANQTVDQMDDVWGIHIHHAPVGTNGPHVFNVIGRPANDDADVVPNFAADSLTGLWDDGDESGASPPDTKKLSDFADELKSGELVLVVHTWGTPNDGGLAGGKAIAGRITQVPEPSGLMFLGMVLACVPWCRKRHAI